MVVLLGGAALGSRLGMSSQVLYLLAGLAGLPVFAASPMLPQGLAAPARSDRRLPDELSVRRVRHRLARRARLRSPLSHVSPRDGRRPRASSSRAASPGSRCSRAPPRRVSRPRSRTGLYPFIPADIVKICIAAADHAGTLELTAAPEVIRDHGTDQRGSRSRVCDSNRSRIPYHRIPASVILHTPGSGADRSFPDRAVFRCAFRRSPTAARTSRLANG